MISRRRNISNYKGEDGDSFDQNSSTTNSSELAKWLTCHVICRLVSISQVYAISMAFIDNNSLSHTSAYDSWVNHRRTQTSNLSNSSGTQPIALPTKKVGRFNVGMVREESPVTPVIHENAGKLYTAAAVTCM